MMRTLRTRILFLPRLFLIVSLPLTIPSSAQQASGVASTAPQVRMVRSVVGANGESRNSAYVITDARTTFYPASDREVIVYFEWEGALGKHHCEGSVRGPSGEFVVLSSFDYTATKPRFAGFWKMPISESTPPGRWIFESKVDGEPAGQATFQIVPGNKPADLAASPVPPTPAEVYKQSLAAIVQIDSLNAQGRVLRHSTGFFWRPKQVLTSFHSIDGATSLRLRFPDGKESSVSQLLAWNRQQDWVILSVDAENAPLKLAEPKSTSVGDSCYWIDVKNFSSRILAQGQIVGEQSLQPWGDRIELSSNYNFYAEGGPVLNEQGQAFALLGGSLPSEYLAPFAAIARPDTLEPLYAPSSSSTVPLRLVLEAAPSQSVTFQDLWAQGQMIPPVTNNRSIQYAMLTQETKLAKSPAHPIDRDPKFIFQTGDSVASIVASFPNTEKLETTTQINLYDVDNHLVALGKPQKLSIAPGDPSERLWNIPLSSLKPGLYRIDLLVGNAVAWRQFFKLAD